MFSLFPKEKLKLQTLTLPKKSGRLAYMLDICSGELILQQMYDKKMMKGVCTNSLKVS